MKRTPVPALALLLLVGACGDGDRSNCAIAKEKLDECNAELEANAPFGPVDFRGLPIEVYDECSGWNACDASCLKGASCSDMQIALLGRGSDPNRAPSEGPGLLRQCLQACYDGFERP
ncbi:MAG TPA: hypothetical protein VER12_13765 [Polyangiaceae bacterium]|nr:hypothetical protein [Polyangiaceae bacterium]